MSRFSKTTERKIMGIFGGTTSKDVVCSLINSAASIINNANTQCLSSTTQSEVLSLNGCSNVNLSDINFNEVATVDSSCIATNASSNDVSQDISDQVCQTAATVKDTFLPQLDTTSSETYDGLVEDLTTSIKSAFNTTCSQDLQSDQSFSCKNSDNITVQHINFDSFAKGTESCIADNVMTSSAATELCNFLTQHSDTLNTDPLADLVNGIVDSPLIMLGILAIVALFILVPLFGGEKIIMDMVEQPVFWIALVILVIFLVVFFDSGSVDNGDDSADSSS